MERRTRLSLVTGPAPEQALPEAIDAFLRRGQARNLSPSTVRSYRDRLGAFARYLENRDLRLGPDEVTPQVVRDVLTSERERVTAATANHSRVALSAFFRSLLNEEFITANPMEKVRLPRRVVPTFSAGRDASLSEHWELPRARPSMPDVPTGLARRRL